MHRKGPGLPSMLAWKSPEKTQELFTVKGIQMKRIFVGVLGLFLALSAQAMNLLVQGNTLFASGPVEDDYGKFTDALAKPGIERVVLLNSPGGDLWTGMNVGRLIASKGLHTVVAGYCISSCSIMFMGGQTRSFSSVYPPRGTLLGIHGPHNLQTKRVNPLAAGQIYAFFKQQIGERFNADIINKALYEMEDAGALLRVYHPIRPPALLSHHCRAVQTPRKDCTDFKDHDALTLGLITSTELTSLELPESLRAIPTVLGRELTELLGDPEGFLEAISSRQCTADSCRKLATGLLGLRAHKAIAVPVTGAGLGTTANRASPEHAFLSAVYVCNHVKDRPVRLCETQAVNSFDTRGFYIPQGPAPEAVLAKLVPPAERFYANEEFGGSMTSATGLRTQKMVDITPQSLDGIPVLGTQALVRALKGPAAPVLIDVGYAAVTLPGAQTLLFGGLAFDEAPKELAYEARFQGLLKLLSPDPAAPVVFFSTNRESWFSVNAALRASKLGYTQVRWYRGGLESWSAAGLPVMLSMVRAVAN